MLCRVNQNHVASDQDAVKKARRKHLPQCEFCLMPCCACCVDQNHVANGQDAFEKARVQHTLLKAICCVPDAMLSMLCRSTMASGMNRLQWRKPGVAVLLWCHAEHVAHAVQVNVDFDSVQDS